MHDDNSSEASAALELLQIKHRKPSRDDCRATSDLLLAIFQSQHTTDADSSHHRHWVLMTTTGHRPSAAALLPAGDDDDAAYKYADAPRVVSGSFDLPMPIAHAHDERYLSPLQCYIRKICLEYFAATASNVTTKGRQTLVSEGRVGVRCSFCKYLPRGQQAAQATSFPNQIASIYSSVVMLQCRHFPFCSEMPASAREHVEALRKAGNATTNLCGTKRRDFWSYSARCMGFVDTDAGVQFIPRVADTLSSEMSYNDLEVVASPSTNDIEVFPESIAVGLPRLNFVSPFESESITESHEPITIEQLISGSTLVTLEDRDLVPDYVFLALAQLAPCQLIADDRIGAYRARPIGFTGMCCRYCQGCQPGPGFGKFFPNSIRSLAQTTTTQTIIKHITSKCMHVPRDVKDVITKLLHEAEEENKPAYAPKKSDTFDGRPKYGSRKEFFQRVWDRLHGNEEEAVSTSIQAGGIPEFDGSTVIAAIPSIEVVRPIPMRHPIPFSSSDVPPPLCRDNHYDYIEESCIGTQNLIGDKYRRVTIRGISLTSNEYKKRHFSAFASISEQNKKPRKTTQT
ncbi:hypothetical protein ACHAW5_004581 [Stephanodiscus triporus]|uniref:Uncharacterized protein n=1 Tax=Stephanodiscus triporus TaxID=2934178 RepID=A0ABD3QWN5_9STRA